MSLEELSSPQEIGSTPEQPIEEGTSAAGNSETLEMSQLLADADAFAGARLVPGTIVDAHVEKVSETEVVISLGLKTEMAVPISEFQSTDGKVSVAPGDTVKVWIESHDEETGRVAISHQKAARLKVWDEIEKAYQEQTNITGKVLERIKGGLTVDVGVPAFLARISRRRAHPRQHRRTQRPGYSLQNHQNQPQAEQRCGQPQTGFGRGAQTPAR